MDRSDHESLYRRVRLSPQSRRVATIAAVTTGTLAASTAGFAATMPGPSGNASLEPTAATGTTTASVIGGGSHGTTLAASTAGLAGKIGNPDPTLTSVSIVPDQATVAPDAPVVFTVRATLVGTGQPVAGQRVRIAVANGPQWTTTAQLQTDGRGIAKITTRLLSTTTLTAVFDGTNALRPSLASATTVTVRSPVASGSVSGSVSGSSSASSATPKVIPGSSIGQKIVYLASLQKGKPYIYGAAGPNAFDCSGYSQYVFKQLGRYLPRTAQQQFDASIRIPKAAKQPGDLIFFGSPDNITHMGIYAGNGYMWAAPQTGRTINLQPIYTSTYWVGRFL
ncbi:C40 family peptidase [Protofrankia symbiont of Coriaria ruscifolia]|uniref:C40 family peptidase n=1 Tax=Protofrankia symbiont of Coriaria ruscifolia TaxID=1306542 RepID=UPI0010415605|nr:C40 family peptidase [Protofrankia symbiont of Coriaria ruscifolia]